MRRFYLELREDGWYSCCPLGLVSVPVSDIALRLRAE